MIAQATAAGPLRADPSKRVNYTLGLVLGVDEFQQEQLYHAAGRRGHNRLLHGYGTVWGLKVETPSPSDTDPEIRVSAGVAVDPCGREICVPDTMCVKLSAWLTRHRDTLQRVYGSANQTVPLAVVLCHRECPDDAVPVPGEPCRSQEDAMQPSRIRDSFELRLALRDDAPWGSPPVEGTTGLHVFKHSHPEEQAVRAFGLLLSRVGTTTDPDLDTGEAELIAAVRALKDAAKEGTLASPPAANDDPILLPAATAPDILREAFRVWVTEVRPELRGQEGEGRTCGDASGECCVLLSEIDLPVNTQWAVRAEAFPSVELRRPYLLHTRLLQEWLISGSAEGERPDVDRFATLELLGPHRVRAWLHHAEWLYVPASAVQVRINDAEPVAPLSVDEAEIRNVFDVVLDGDLNDGDTVELLFDTEQVFILAGSPPRDPGEAGEAPNEGEEDNVVRRSWRPSQGTRTGTVADELRGPTGEYLDRHGFTLRAYTIYDRLQGGDLTGEFRLPVVAKIQRHPVDAARPQNDEYLRWHENPASGGGARWIPSPLPPGEEDVSGVYPVLKVTGIHGFGVGLPDSNDRGKYLRWNGTGWAVADIESLQKRPVSEEEPKGSEYLMWDGEKWNPSPIVALQTRPMSGDAPQAHQYLGWDGDEWRPRLIDSLRGRPISEDDPRNGQYLMWDNAAGVWRPMPVVSLQGNAVSDLAPDPGEVLTWNGRAWVPAPLPIASPPDDLPLNGDVTGDAQSNRVERIQGRPVRNVLASETITPGHVLTWSGTAGGQWQPQAIPAPPAVTLGGDASGPAGRNQVLGIMGRPISTAAATTPKGEQVLRLNAGATEWQGAFAVDALGNAPYAIAAAGHFRLEPGVCGLEAVPMSVYANLKLGTAGISPLQNPLFELAFDGFVPGDPFTYIVKGMVAAGVVMLFRTEPRLVIELMPVNREFGLRGELHLEVSRFRHTPVG